VINRLKSLSFITTLAALFAMISWGSLLNAQQSSPDSQQPSSQTQSAPQNQQPPDTQAPPSSSEQTPRQQTPNQAQPPQNSDQAQGSDQSGGKEFVGTVVKQGDKYMFQEASTGTTYDIDHQDEVKKFEGKKVRVHGTLDPNGKMIHVQ
jgi:Protein of unknown function (DUF5818)